MTSNKLENLLHLVCWFSWKVAWNLPVRNKSCEQGSRADFYARMHLL